MIIKGKSRSEPGALAAHLGNAEKNERVTLLETKGVVAADLRGALIEMDAYAAGSKATKSLYHAAISPEPPHRMTSDQRNEAVDALEAKLGLSGHSRIVVMHEKLGREHIHVVWSRINLQTMKAVHDGHNYRKHEEVSRDLERRFGHDRVQGAHHERDGVERPNRTPSRADLRQEERTGIKAKQIREHVTALFKSCDTPQAFAAALKDNGYVLAQGDRRDFVIIDRAGGIHSLARRIGDVKAADLRTFMSPVDRASLPDVEQAKIIAADRKREAEQREEDKRQNKTEKGYAGGADYVSQSTAAQKDFQRRQEKLNKKHNNAVRTFDYGKTSEDVQDSERKGKAAERMRRLLGDLESDGRQHDPDRETEDDRQQEAPGGEGRTRSR